VTTSAEIAEAGTTLAFSVEHEELRSMVRRFLLDRSPEAEVRRLMETLDGHDSAAWMTMAQQLGLQGLQIPAEYGGSGSGFVELQIVCDEMGRALQCAPFFSSAVLATSVLLCVDDPIARQQYLPGLADGSIIATLAMTESDGEWSADGIVTAAVQRGEGADDRTYQITGEKLFVLDGMVASLLLVVARTYQGPSLFAVDPTAHGVHREALSTLDETRKQARITLDRVEGTLVGVDGGAAAPLVDALDRGAAALAAEQAGGARRTLEMAVEYAKVREQFGRPIGSYQAIKHKCADMLLEVESATSAAYAAGWAIDGRTSEVGVLASLAKAYCSEAYYHCAAENIQIHGGIGFTWEYPAHLYFKRARSTEALLGSPRHHRELLAERLGL
jgi:alkylation response protein AidB-like acyl-CoA dehydrogenase